MKNACQNLNEPEIPLYMDYLRRCLGKKIPGKAAGWHDLTNSNDMKKLSDFWKVVKKAAVEFDSDNGFKLAASLSYSTIFAMGPLLIVVISLAGIFLGHDAVEGRIYHQIKGLVGNAAALQIQDIIKNIQGSRHTVAGAIIGEASLSFLGLGVQPPTPSWGTMLNGGRAHILDAPHLTLFPGLAIALLVLGLNFLGDGLRDRIDPRSSSNR